MASLTTHQLLHELRQACDDSLWVAGIEEQLIDHDILKVRVYLTIPETFISVFYNIAAGKTSFALVTRDARIYGVDNAKMGWHEHPLINPILHIPCLPMSFAEFLARVDEHLTKGA